MTWPQRCDTKSDILLPTSSVSSVAVGYQTRRNIAFAVLVLLFMYIQTYRYSHPVIFMSICTHIYTQT